MELSTFGLMLIALVVVCAWAGASEVVRFWKE